jgi:tetratricopeptide (TPR) repeat protein
LLCMASLAISQNDYGTARELYGESLELYREVGDQWALGDALLILAKVAMEQADYARARSLLQETLRIRQQLGSKTRIAEALEEFASLAALQRQPKRAVRLFAAAQGMQESPGRLLSPADCTAEDRPQLLAVRADLGEEAYAAAWAAGRAMSLDQAIEYALDRSGSG